VGSIPTSPYFMHTIYFYKLQFVAESLLTFFPILITVSYFTLIERKILASIQRRQGPQIVGIWGTLQPIVDGLKLVLKEMVTPRRSDFILYWGSPSLSLFCSFLSWTTTPLGFGDFLVESPYNSIWFLVFTSLNSYGIFLAGYGSNNKYALISCLRSVVQVMSYEVVLLITILPIFSLVGSFDLSRIVYFQQNFWFIFLLSPMAGAHFICILAETQRAPFDLIEAESELVAGYSMEYSGIQFAVFFLGEYSSILSMSTNFSIFFLGGWLSFILPGNLCLTLKVMFIC
jgi:NADH:ubiquinone oxidoreductase subunit H